MCLLKVLMVFAALTHLETIVQAALLSEEKIECTPLEDCPHVRELLERKKFHYGTRTILNLLHCHFTNGQPYIKCINSKTIQDFMDKAELLPDYNECGLESTEPKILGGEVTGITDYPWIALLKYRSSGGVESYGCHGNLINRRYVLTAAHCVHPETTKKFLKYIYSVVLGEYDIRNETDCLRSAFGDDCADKIKEFTVESYHVHPEYNTTSHVNDIALIRMSGDVEWSDFIRPVCLPPVNLLSPFNESLWIAGWGNTDTDEMNPVKVKAVFQLRKSNSCNVNVKLTRNQFCASSPSNAKTCPGDSGGPLMMRRKIEDSFRYFLIGVDSLGVSCSVNLRISIYTKVSPYVEWMITNLKK